MDTEEAKYTRAEYERRFIVSPQSNWKSSVESYSKSFEDKYFRDSRLRLRLLIDSDTGRRLIKLTKKVESDSAYAHTISRILLTQNEYAFFGSLAGDNLKKTRYYHNYQGRVFSVDVFEGELEGLILCETEADSIEDLMKCEPPQYAKQEVSEDEFFRGGNLCRVTRAELLRKLSSFD